MNTPRRYLLPLIWTTLLLFGLLPAHGVHAQRADADCAQFAYSTEVDFVSQGPPPDDGNLIISDGDLLGRWGVICMRNRELLAFWDIRPDLGLDAVDVIDFEQRIVAFSTELHDPKARFKAGDLLTTSGVVIPNAALLRSFQLGHDIGLDGLHFVGATENILRFLTIAKDVGRSDWFEAYSLQEMLTEYDVDIWFSTEGTERVAATTQILDGDLLSARHGITVLRQDMILPATVPAGIVDRGVDFGLDAVTSTRTPSRPSVRFSTEILFNGNHTFTDGDVLRAVTGNVEIHHPDLTAPFEPYARFLGLDALHIMLNDIEAEDTLDPSIDHLYQDTTNPPLGSKPDQEDEQWTYLPSVSSGDQQSVVAGP